MVIVSFAEPQELEYASALAAGYGIEWRRPDPDTGHRPPLRLISQGDHAVELDALGDRLMDTLESRMGWPTGPHSQVHIPADQPFHGSLIPDHAAAATAGMETSTCPR